MIKQSLLLRNKILFFTGVPVDDAATLYRSGLVARKLAKRGYQVIFTSVSANFRGEIVKKVSDLLVLFIGQAHYFAKRPFSSRRRFGLVRILIENLKTCFRFSQILRKEKPDRVLVVTAMPISLMAGLVAKILGFKTLIDIEDLVIGQMESAGYPKFLAGIYGFIENVWVKIFDRVAVCSHYLGQRYPSSVLIPNMVEVDWWRRRTSRDFTKLVFVGQIGPYHGQMEVLESLAPVLRENKNLKLVFVGGGERLESLKLKVKNEKLEKQIVLTGQLSQDKVRKILMTTDIGLLPLWDTPVHEARHPLKLLEYLAAGLVVVTNKVGEAERIIKDGKNGILCPAGNIKCLVEKVKMVLGKPDLARKIGKKATDSVKEFSTEKILPKWIKFLEQ